ncbi:hypothetical protein IWW47_000097 [Coemansia sp. RSA 2052]|nr:hypothetical protein IWW47_000097 [Coemansia sp. RSA 2052]
MNRLGLENFTEHLSADMSFQASDQIIMYTSTSGSGILGVWIYEEADRVRIPEQLGQCCKSVKSAFSGQSPQRLYPKNSDEEKEFERLYPRSRSNSRKDAGADYQGSSNALSTIVNRSRQQQNHKQNVSDAKAPAVPSANILDLASKMQAIGIDFHAGNEAQQQDASANALALPSDPAIIMARKSVKPHEMSATGGDGQKTQQQQQSQLYQQKQQYAQTNSESDTSEFRSPLSVPAVHASSSSASYHSINGGAPVGVPQPASPVLHPVPSPFPPSTIATPLPGQGPQQVGPGMAYAQQMPQYWYHPQMATSPPMNRSAHASPAPPNFGGMVPGMYAFPQLPLGHLGHPGTAHVSQPMMHMGPVQQQQPAQPPPPPPPFVPGPMQSGPPVPQSMGPRGLDAAGGTSSSVAHNLAEQLVSLVRQRMKSAQQGSASGPAAVSQQKPGLSPDALKAQRDYCRAWLIRVIQADDELVDAFAQRFPPPIFPPAAGSK